MCLYKALLLTVCLYWDGHCETEHCALVIVYRHKHDVIIKKIVKFRLKFVIHRLSVAQFTKVVEHVLIKGSSSAD